MPSSFCTPFVTSLPENNSFQYCHFWCLIWTPNFRLFIPMRQLRSSVSYLWSAIINYCKLFIPRSIFHIVPSWYIPFEQVQFGRSEGVRTRVVGRLIRTDTQRNHTSTNSPEWDAYEMYVATFYHRPQLASIQDPSFSGTMRVIVTAQKGLLPHYEATLSNLIAILTEISKNPSNPKFNHYTFESISALIRYVNCCYVALIVTWSLPNLL